MFKKYFCLLTVNESWESCLSKQDVRVLKSERYEMREMRSLTGFSLFLYLSNLPTWLWYFPLISHLPTVYSIIINIIIRYYYCNIVYVHMYVSCKPLKLRNQSGLYPVYLLDILRERLLCVSRVYVFSWSWKYPLYFIIIIFSNNTHI